MKPLFFSLLLGYVLSGCSVYPDQAFLDSTQDGYDNRKIVSIDVETGTPPASYYQSKVFYVPTSFGGTAASICDNESGYSSAKLLNVPLVIDSSAKSDSEIILCLRGRTSQRGRTYVTPATAYRWLRDSRLPVNFSLSESETPPANESFVNLEWTNAQTPNDLPNSPMSYDVVLSTQVDCGNPLLSQSDLTDLSTSLGPVADGDYYACVTAKDAAGNSRVASNGPLMVTVGSGPVLPLPGGFLISGPVSPVLDDDILVEWSASTDATSYQVTLSDNNDCSSPFYTQSTTALSQIINDLGGRTIYICVSAINNTGSTAASNQPYELFIDYEAPKQILFVSDIEYFIEEFELIPPAIPYLGSAEAADHECTRLASVAGLLGGPWDQSTYYYRALMTVDSSTLTDRAGVSDIRVVNVLDQLIAPDRFTLYSGSHASPILTSSGQSISGTTVPVWTGSTGTGQPSGFSCDSWHDQFAPGGTVGNLNGIGTTWLDNGTSACYIGARLYCISI